MGWEVDFVDLAYPLVSSEIIGDDKAMKRLLDFIRSTIAEATKRARLEGRQATLKEVLGKVIGNGSADRQWMIELLTKEFSETTGVNLPQQDWEASIREDERNKIKSLEVFANKNQDEVYQRGINAVWYSIMHMDEPPIGAGQEALKSSLEEK